MKITRASAWTLVGLMAVPAAVNAQVPGAPSAPSIGVSVGVKAGTLGVGPEIGVRLAPRIGIRGGFTFASLGRDLDVSGIGYEAKLKLNAIHGLLDLYLLGPFRLSAGLVRNGNKLEINANPVSPVSIGDTTYAASDIGVLTGTVDFRKGAGYLGFGIGGRGRIGLIMDLGVMMQGSPRVAFTATPATTLPAAAQARLTSKVAAEVVSIQSDLDDRSYIKMWPVVSVGLQVKL